MTAPPTRCVGHPPTREWVRRFHPSGRGHLAYFAHVSRNITTDLFVLNVVAHGYALMFDELGPPKLLRIFLHLSRPLSPQVEAVLALEAKHLLAKCAIEVVQDPSYPGFYSHLFLVDKRDGGYTPVIDLSALNQHLEPMCFKMESISSIMVALKWGMDYVHRPEGCILPHSNGKVCKEVSPVCYR